jgi:hypothetical protein
MKRWLLLPLFVASGLFLALPGAAAVRDDMANATLSIVSGQYQLTVDNTGDTIIKSFTFAPAAALHVTAISSSSTGSCQLSGNGFTCSVNLNPPPCMCTSGDSVNVLFSGNGEASGSKVQIGKVTVNVGGGGSIAAPAATPPPTTTPPVTTPPATTPKAKAKAPLCKKGQKSTAKKPCRKR